MAMDQDDASFEALFTNESYEKQTFRAGSHTLQLLCSESASTDYDLTGQIMWPAAQLLADYLTANMHIMAGCPCALELGSGLGFPGLVAAQHCPVILTDHNPVVLKVLERNAELNTGDHRIRCLQLDWDGDSDTLTSILLQSPDRQGFDVLLGSDVAYSLKALPHLFKVAASLLSKRPSSVFILGYVSRAASIDRGIFLEAAAAGLRTREVDGTRKAVPGGLEGAVYEVRWAHLAGGGTAPCSRTAGSGVRRKAKGSPAQTGIVLAATVGPLLAGVALSYFLSGSSK
ncbi:g3059 [Coccomyxa viridis]|uniref:G3059 protein n=1 Tax=Coccomyxa viridis TaxID=1274662 RepID=A0ABP1FLW4_9CHLO